MVTPMRGAQEVTMELHELTACLQRNETVTRTMVDALETHATILSESICDNFKALHSITSRHESLIRQRWIRKTVAERRKILLAAWPGMPKEHRPDISAATKAKAGESGQAGGCLPDRFIWPFINQEDLTTSRTLLVFLNSRGRKTPWEFAAFDTDFSPVLKMAMGGCSDKEFCKTMKIQFTEVMDPKAYGRVKRIKGDPSKHFDRYDQCARGSFHVLLIQQRILAFLVDCVKSILQDMSDDQIFDAPIQEEPPISQVVIERHMEHTSFTQILNMAPYRGWNCMNFTQLRGYVQGTLSTQRNHVWALREDPGYFSDTVQDYLDHSWGAMRSTCAMSPRDIARLPGYHKSILTDVFKESFAMLNGWDFINTRLDRHEKLMHEGATKEQQALPILELQNMAHCLGEWLLNRVYHCFHAAPECRRLLLRKCACDVTDLDYEFTHDTTTAERDVLEVFKSFRREFEGGLLHWPDFLSFYLEQVGHLLQTSARAREMITGRVMSLLTDLSIITEIMRQLGLWVKSPEVKTGRVNGCACNIPVDEGAGIGFDEWSSALGKSFRPPLDLIFPLRDKLNYPEHKKHGPYIVATMRKAEGNLDRFWAAIDAHFQEKTGVAQHRVIRECIEGNGKMHRTDPWEENLDKAKTPAHEYHLIFDQLHDKAAQITGAFDRMIVIDKVKPKTRGGAEAGTEVPSDVSVKPPNPEPEVAECVFRVDKRTYKVFRTLLSAPLDGVGECPKSTKWVEFRRGMVRIGFSAEKLQGSAWQFMPTKEVGIERGIQFHEPHPDSEITYVIAKRMGRRLGRVYGWHGDMFQLA